MNFQTCYFLTENGILKTPAIIEAMKLVDRGHFAKFNAYTDSPQSIGYAVTISAPHMVSIFTCQVLDHQ
jgi:protein-L-isoaspartate(D-aspartate) O-methyltransferase